MLKNLKELKKEADERIIGRIIPRDEDGRAIIDMCVFDDGGFLSPYSPDGSPTISEDAAEFIRSSALGLGTKEQFTLHLSGDCIGERERAVYPGAIRNYFERHYADTAYELKKNTAESIVLFIVGVVGLSLMLAGELLGWNGLWVSLLDVFSCFFIWETVDLFFLSRARLRRVLCRNLAFINMKVVFLKPSDAPSTCPPAE